MRRYRTIVADPPWPQGRTTPTNPRCQKCGRQKFNHTSLRCHCAKPEWVKTPIELPYDTMSIEELSALPVAELSECDAHLYLWTTQRFLCDAYGVVDRWGFVTSAVLVWSKAPKGLGGTFTCSAEFVLFARRGSLRSIGKHCGTVFSWPRKEHSAKPDAFYDLVEQISPGPYAELFARRARFGWDYPIGDQALGGVAA